MRQIGQWSVLGALALSGLLLSSTTAWAQKQPPASDATISKCIHEVNRVSPYNPALGGDDKRRLNLYRACLRNGGQIPGGV